MPNYQLIIFDFDGTLADSATWMIRTMNEIGGSFGVRRVSDAEVDMLRGRSNSEIVRYLGVPLWKVPRIATEMRRRLAADIEHIRLFDGVEHMLRALDERGAQLAIVSSNSEANVRHILGPQNAARIDVYECEAALFGKARKLRSVMRALHASPATTLYIGDETRDIEAAREVNVASGAVKWGYAKRDVLASFRPTLMLDSMQDILNAVA